MQIPSQSYGESDRKSTISAEIAGLIAAADLADANHDTASAQVWRGVADDWQRSIKGWTVTTNGPLSKDPYFIRLSKTGDPNAAITAAEKSLEIDPNHVPTLIYLRSALEQSGRFENAIAVQKFGVGQPGGY